MDLHEALPAGGDMRHVARGPASPAFAGGGHRAFPYGAGRCVRPADVQRLMASPDGGPPEDALVEHTVERLLRLTGLPGPEWPVDGDAPPG